MWIVELLIVLFFHLAGGTTGKHRHRFCRRLRRAGPGAFRRQAGRHPDRRHPDHHGGDRRHRVDAGGRRARLPGAYRHENTEKESEIHHLPGTGGHLHHDPLCRDRPHRLLDAAGDCRSGQTERDQAVTAALHRHRRLADCHHRITDLGRRGLLLERTGKIRGRLRQAADDHDPEQFSGMPCWARSWPTSWARS